jgi:lipoprotein-anchoring transpeptidase ErfK/SrfK
MHRKAVALAGLLSAALFSQHAAAQGLFWGNSYEARQPQYAAYGGQARSDAYGAQYGAYGSTPQYGYYAQPDPSYDEQYRPQPTPIPRQLVDFDTRHAPGTIVISTAERRLYYVTRRGEAIQYAVGVGRPGFEWAGTKSVSLKREWPDWRPPAEMIRRRPDLPRYMPGGPDNPLGARAMYLGGTLYRIHGSNEPETIGQAVSSGCIRMTNEDVIDLYNRVRLGSKVVVLR